MFLIALFQLFIPLFFIGLVAFGRQPNRLRWALVTLGFGLAILFMWVSSRWDFLSLYLRHVYLLLFLIAAAFSYRRIQPLPKPESRWQTIANRAAFVALIVLMLGLNWRAWRGYTVPDGAIDLASPLRNGRFMVLNGGGSPFINGHARVAPQNYALDMLGLDALGRSIGLGDDRAVLENYHIFGAPLYSPCAGTVLHAVDQFEDLIPPATDTVNLAGNYVLVDCGAGVEVILAHMKADSVQVTVGESVTTETMLGQVGNTGNTSEPHLHMHAERGGDVEKILDGEAVPILINGRYLVRSNVIDE